MITAMKLYFPNALKIPNQYTVMKTARAAAIAIIAITAISSIPTAAADKYTDCIRSCDQHESEAQFWCQLICFVGTLFTK